MKNISIFLSASLTIILNLFDLSGHYINDHFTFPNILNPSWVIWLEFILTNLSIICNDIILGIYIRERYAHPSSPILLASKFKYALLKNSIDNFGHLPQLRYLQPRFPIWLLTIFKRYLLRSIFVILFHMTCPLCLLIYKLGLCRILIFFFISALFEGLSAYSYANEMIFFVLFAIMRQPSDVIELSAKLVRYYTSREISSLSIEPSISQELNYHLSRYYLFSAEKAISIYYWQ